MRSASRTLVHSAAALNPVTHQRGHFGVDFHMCSDEKVLSIGPGLVTDVIPDTPSDDPLYNGGIVIIRHKIPGHDPYEILILYAHLSRIRVSEGESVDRGQVIGEFWESPDGGWIRHVHVQVFGTNAPLQIRDPSPLMSACLNTGKPDQYIYPVSC